MKKIKGRVISTVGNVADIKTKVGVYEINRAARARTDFYSPLKKGDKVLLIIDPGQNNMLLAIEKTGD